MATRVLVVEDHADSCELLANLLRRWGFEVQTANTLQSALECLKERFSAIISDIALPDGTGFAVISEAKRRDRHVLGIALSGYGSDSDIQVGKLAGFDHHLTKPFDCERIRSLLALCGAPRATHGDENTDVPVSVLTSREREILHSIAEGKTNREIGESLAISARTVEVHRANLVRKLNLDSMAGLIRYAIRNKVVDA
jgi:DNA-binding NarL/FixJ family response regulator